MKFLFLLAAVMLLWLGVMSAAWSREHHEHPLKVEEPKLKRLNRLTDEVTRVVGQESNSSVPRRNYVDELIFAKIEKNKIPYAGLATDAEFLRRIHLDLTGRLPEPEAIRRFLADKDPNKRDKLVEELMTTKISLQLQKPRTPFLDRWSYFLGELFRNGMAHLGNGRNVFHDYLYDALLLNVPYNQLATELITAKTRSNWQDGPSNFLVRDHVDGVFDFEGINNEDTYDEMAITTAKLFLGVDLECVSCHNGEHHLEKINLGLSKVKRASLWRQASFFSKTRVYRPYSISQEFALVEDGKGYDLKSKSVVRMERQDADVTPEFLLTGEKPQPNENWRAAYARMLTSHPQFAKATVNVIWAELMGVGIVDPPLEFDLARQDPQNPPPAPWTIQPAHPELLDALAKDFVAHNYDLRHVIRVIVTSSAYQLSSHFKGAWKEQYASYFARRFVRRLTAEELCDAIQQASGVFSQIPIAGTTLKVQRVMETRSPEDLAGAELHPMLSFLTSFGQNNRDKGDKDRNSSMVQTSILMNSKFVKDRIRVTENSRMGKLLNSNPPLSNEEIVDEMFLAFLSRFPDPKEKKVTVAALEKYHSQGLEDLAWSLVNRPDFLFYY
ncbi:MAG: DUF1549 and DUF1553 domain-containing protein [Acidobacteria bacterium]|nr:DUF1549 and DUF1553 domain-containing protein [Acidobacteriota bacterium]MCI0722023.1 DUF1549 and DUF1553 domain-containing protein [Acidobacteriota bacterium]